MSRWVSLLLAIGLAACAGSNSGVRLDGIDGRDRSAFVPVLRGDLVRPWLEPSTIEGFGEVEVDLLFGASISTLDGSYSQRSWGSLVGGTLTSGRLDVDFRMTEVAVTAGFRASVADWVRTALYAGPGFHRTDLKVAATSGRASDSKASLGIVFGVLAEADLTEDFEVFIRGEFMMLDASTHTLKIEFGVGYDVAEDIEIMAGYRVWDYDEDHGNTDIALGAGGFLLGATYHF